MTLSLISVQIKQMMERQMTSKFFGDEMTDRNWDIYNTRLSGCTAKETGSRFGIQPERVRQIFLKATYIKKLIKFREESPPESLAALRLTLRFKRVLANDFHHAENNLRSVKVIDFIREASHRELLRCPDMGHAGVRDFMEEAGKVVGKETMQRWFDGENV
jgi:hypothetical protein